MATAKNDDFSGFGPSVDDDDNTNTPYDAFNHGGASDDNVDQGEDGGLVIDLTDGADKGGKPAKGKTATREDDDDLEIEVVHEVPGNRAADDAALEEDDDTVSAEEMADYSENVRKRISKQTRLQRAAERRAERFRGEVDEATRIIVAQAEQLERLKTMVKNGETQYVQAAKAASAAAVSSAQQKLRQAMTDGDADKIVEAQTELGRATAALSQAEQYRAVAPDVERDANTVSEQVKRFAKSRENTVNEPDPAAARWMSRNRWFQKDPGMTNYAIQYAKTLEADGVDPVEDAAYYYKEIDKEMKRRFSDKLQDDDGEPRRGAQNRQPQRQQQQQRRPVGGARQSGPVITKGKIQLTESQVRIAAQLGISPKEYALEYVKTYGSK
jgi:hypothetical protein